MSVWKAMEEARVGRFPLPLVGRIPNFQGAERAAHRVAGLEIYRKAKTVKVNPDAPQLPLRAQVLKDGKTLLVPTPRLKAGFVQVRPEWVPPGEERRAASLSASPGIRAGTAPVGPPARRPDRRRLRRRAPGRSAAGKGRRIRRPGICHSQGIGQSPRSRDHHRPFPSGGAGGNPLRTLRSYRRLDCDRTGRDRHPIPLSQTDRDRLGAGHRRRAEGDACPRRDPDLDPFKTGRTPAE